MSCNSNSGQLGQLDGAKNIYGFVKIFGDDTAFAASYIFHATDSSWTSVEGLRAFDNVSNQDSLTSLQSNSYVALTSGQAIHFVVIVNIFEVDGSSTRGHTAYLQTMAFDKSSSIVHAGRYYALDPPTLFFDEIPYQWSIHALGYMIDENGNSMGLTLATFAQSESSYY